MRRTLISTVLTAAVLAGWQPPATAQAYPSKPIRIISPFSPGGGNDTICRTIAPKLVEGLGQRVFVENRAGANGVIGTELAARSAPDGYTVVLIPSGHAVNASLRKKLPYDSIRDFTPITMVGSSPLVLVVHPAVPARGVKGLVVLAKARAGELTYGSAGVGSSGHLAGALFETLAGVKMVHVPYKGMALAITDLISGQIFLSFATSLSSVPHVRSRRLRALATTGAQRAAVLPDLPTVAESVPGYEASLWYGFVGPAGIPDAIVRRLNSEIVAALGAPDVRQRLTGQGLEVRPSAPEEFGRLLRNDLARWARVVERAGLRPQ